MNANCSSKARSASRDPPEIVIRHPAGRALYGWIISRDKMHADELDIPDGLVKRLLEVQFPQWAGLLLERVRSAGTDHAMYRLGEEMVVRIPRVGWAVEQVEKEQRWLPKLAPLLPLAIPMPLGRGRPGEGYPWSWSIYRWLEGENATLDRLADPYQAATDLAGFVRAQWGIDATEGPVAGEHNFGRGVPLALRDGATRAAIQALKDDLDSDALTAAWDSALAAPDWDLPPVWIHGDLQSGNLLTADGQLSAVIDFGGLGVGDPACDLIVAWNFFDADIRTVFQVKVGVDEATWARGRGWALSIALIALPYYRNTNPEVAALSRRTIDQVLAEHSVG